MRRMKIRKPIFLRLKNEGNGRISMLDYLTKRTRALTRAKLIAVAVILTAAVLLGIFITSTSRDTQSQYGAATLVMRGEASEAAKKTSLPHGGADALDRYVW